MDTAPPREKDTRAVDRGRLGALRRWGPPRAIYRDRTDPVTWEIVSTIVAARENVAKAARDARAEAEAAAAHAADLAAKFARDYPESAETVAAPPDRAA